MSHQIGDTMTEAYNDRNCLRSEALRLHLKKVNATAGSLHRIHPSQTYLMLVVAVGLPSDLLPTIEEINIGKGLAGLAWMRESVVSSCNLQNDPNVGLKAKPLPFDSTYAIPFFEHGLVKGVLGVAFDRTVQLNPEMLKLLSVLPPELST